MWLVAAIILLSSSSSFSRPKNSLLWEISGNGLKHPSYLYGTIHSQDKRAFSLVALVDSCIKESDAYGMEINMNVINDTVVRSRIWKSLTMPGDTTQPMLMTQDQYQKLDSFIRDSLHSSSWSLLRIKPFYVLLLLMQKAMAKDSAYRLDEYLMHVAKNEGKEIIGIETIEEHLAAFDGMSLREQATLLLKMIDMGITKLSAHYNKMLDTYSTGDLDLIRPPAAKKQTNLSSSAEFFLVINRNHHMADRIDSVIRTKRLFTAVGAAHLSGDEGIINLLRMKGYILTPILKED